MQKKIRVSGDAFGFLRKTTRLQSMLDTLKEQNVLFYGAGINMEYILRSCQLDSLNFRICSTNGGENLRRGGANLYDTEVEKASQCLLDWADKIIIANFEKRSEILHIIQSYGMENKVVQIYDDNDQVPIYEDMVELDSDKLSNIYIYIYEYKKDKSTNWIKAGSGERYEKEQDTAFFDHVTKEYYLKYIQPGDEVLDVGAGTGRLSIEIFKKGASVTAADVSADMLGVLSKKEDKIKTVVASGDNLPFPDESFDKVVSCDLMCHIADCKGFIREHYRVLRHGGYIIHAMLNGDNLCRISDQRIIRETYTESAELGYMKERKYAVSKQELQDICSELDGLELVEMIPYNFFEFPAMAYGLLTRSEMVSLSKNIYQLYKNEDAAQILSKFERDIVCRSASELAVCDIVVFKKS